MKNWFLPATVLGLTGVALVLSSERGQQRVRHMMDDFLRHGDAIGEFGKFCEEQLDTIQKSLDRLSEALEEQTS